MPCGKSKLRSGEEEPDKPRARGIDEGDPSQKRENRESAHISVRPPLTYVTSPGRPSSIQSPGRLRLRTAREDTRPRRARAAADMMVCRVETRGSTSLGSSRGPREQGHDGGGECRAVTGAMADASRRTDQMPRAKASLSCGSGGVQSTPFWPQIGGRVVSPRATSHQFVRLCSASCRSGTLMFHLRLLIGPRGDQTAPLNHSMGGSACFQSLFSSHYGCHLRASFATGAG